MADENGWQEYKLLITETQERHEQAIEKLRDEVHSGFQEVRAALAALKVKSSLWGALSGPVVALGVILLASSKKLLGV